MATPRTKITEQTIKEHIAENINKWLFAGHIASRHINATKEELQARLGKYSDDGKLITYASSFLDMTDGDDIVDGLRADLQSRTGEILQWLSYSPKDFTILRFRQLPKGVRGVSYSIHKEVECAADGYIAILCKNEQRPFYLLNVYPFVGQW